MCGPSSRHGTRRGWGPRENARWHEAPEGATGQQRDQRYSHAQGESWHEAAEGDPDSPAVDLVVADAMLAEGTADSQR